MSSRETWKPWAAHALCAALFLSFACGVAARAQAGAGWVGGRQGQAGNDLNAVYFTDPKRGWVAGDGGLVLHTEDGGGIWTRQRVETRDAVNDISFRDKEDGYLLAANQIFVTEDGGATWRTQTRFMPQTFGGAEPELYSVRFTSKK